MNRMTTDIYFDLKDKDNDTITKLIKVIKSLQVTGFYRGIRHPPYETLFGGKPRIGLASMNLG